jgi:hypothetical protein
VNQLYSHAHMRTLIDEYAKQTLDTLTDDDADSMKTHTDNADAAAADDRITRRLEFFLSVCTRDALMMRHLFRVYGRCNALRVKSCIHAQMPRAMRVLTRLHPNAYAYARVVAEAAATAEHTPTALVLHCIELLSKSTEQAQPATTAHARAPRLYATPARL